MSGLSSAAGRRVGSTLGRDDLRRRTPPTSRAARGWLAHVDGDALLVKTFAVVPRAAQAPGEAQIEIYANPSHTYIEIEAQGAYETIAPGTALPWRVVWLVRRVPSDVS